MAGWIYFLRAENGAVKIGFTVTPSSRLVSLQCTYGPLEAVATIPGTVDTERWLHEKFAFCQIEGEWFRESDALSAFMRPLGVHPSFLESHRKNRKGGGRPATIRHVKNYPQCPCAKCRARRRVIA